MSRVVFVLVGVALLTACLPLPPPPPQRVSYLVYGDSLSEQSAPVLAQHGTVGKRYFGGTAPCNFSRAPSLTGDAQQFAPTVVLLQFVGNLPVACMAGRDPTLGYEQDLGTIAQFWQTRGVPVIMVILPPTQKGDVVWAQQAERQVAATLGFPVRDAGHAVADNGAFTFFLPCSSPSENRCGAEQAGMVRVRDPDGVHFDSSSGGYSAGGSRFGNAEA